MRIYFGCGASVEHARKVARELSEYAANLGAEIAGTGSEGFPDLWDIEAVGKAIRTSHLAIIVFDEEVGWFEVGCAAGAGVPCAFHDIRRNSPNTIADLRDTVGQVCKPSPQSKTN